MICGQSYPCFQSQGVLRMLNLVHGVSAGCKYCQTQEQKQQTIKELESRIAKLRRQCRTMEGYVERLCLLHNMPPPPSEFVDPCELEGIERFSGIYFLYNEKAIRYVGKSNNVPQRAGGKHEHKKVGDKVAWLNFPKTEIDRVELFYIWLLAPQRNSQGGGPIPRYNVD